MGVGCTPPTAELKDCGEFKDKDLVLSALCLLNALCPYIL